MLSPKNARGLLIAVASVWAIAWFARPFVDPWTVLIGWIIVLPAALCLLLATLFLLVDSVVAGFRRQGWRRFILAAAAIVLLAWPGAILAPGLIWLGAGARLLPHQDEYEQQALAVLALPPDGLPPMYWHRDEGPPRRAALCLEAIADNWTGFVFDPSQTFEQAPEEVFGGDMISSMHLWGPWYYVSFT